jgi:bacterioferritin
MKGNPRIIVALNERLSEELTAINQYVVHSAMYGRWGYAALSKYVLGLARAEMGHADEIIDRILFLEGKPVVSKLNEIRIGSDPKSMLENDRTSETDAVAKYNESVLIAVELKDDGSRALFEDHLKDEESHLLWNEQQLDEIAQMGIENYLANQVSGG